MGIRRCHSRDSLYQGARDAETWLGTPYDQSPRDHESASDRVSLQTPRHSISASRPASSEPTIHTRATPQANSISSDFAHLPTTSTLVQHPYAGAHCLVAASASSCRFNSSCFKISTISLHPTKDQPFPRPDLITNGGLTKDNQPTHPEYPSPRNTQPLPESRPPSP